MVQSHGIPLVPHSTVGWDGQVGWLSQPWDGGTIPWDPTSPTWYSGTGWTGGMAVPAMGRWYNPMGSPCLMVQWDGMDRWDGSHGTVVQSHGIPLVPHGTVGWDDGMAVPAMGRWYNPMGSPCLMVQDGQVGWWYNPMGSH